MLAIVVTMFTIAFAGRAQNTLFAYPVAPDSCTTLESRCNYSVQHFWDNCNLSKPFKAENDSLLVEAMDTWFSIMAAGADANIAISSARDLMFKARVVQANFLQLAMVSEILLFRQPNARQDELYLVFAEAVASDNSVKKDIREYYKNQVKRIKSTKLGEPFPDFTFVGIDGAKHKFSEMATEKAAVLLMVTDGESNSSIERMRLDADVTMNMLIDEGVMKVVNIVATDTPRQWDKDSQSYAARWTVGACKDLLTQADVRLMPCIFLLDNNLNVISKNITVDHIKSLFDNARAK